MKGTHFQDDLKEILIFVAEDLNSLGLVTFFFFFFFENPIHPSSRQSNEICNDIEPVRVERVNQILEGFFTRHHGANDVVPF